MQALKKENPLNTGGWHGPNNKTEMARIWIAGFRSQCVDLCRRVDRLPFFSRLYEMVQRNRPKHSETTSAPLSHTLKTLRGLALFTAAITFAYFAHSSSQYQANQQFRKQFWPDSQTWKQILTAEGYSKMQISQHSSVLKNHPDAYGSKSEVWIRSDGQWIYLPVSFLDPQQSELWSRNSSTTETSNPELNWIHLGSGLNAIENIRTFWNQLPTLIKAARTRPTTVKPIDPKEIRY